MRRPTHQILDDADELARRFEDYEPRAEDQRDPAPLGSPSLSNTTSVTRRKLADLQRLITATSEGQAGDDDFRDIQLAGLRSQAADLREELAEFEESDAQPPAG